MEITTTSLTDCREFSVPCILISMMFFSLYIFIAAGILSNMIPGLMMLCFPDSGFRYIFNGTFFFDVLMIVSFIGSILLIRKMKMRSLHWQAGLPLCIISGIIATLYTIFTFYEPSNPSLRPLAYTITGGVLGYAVLPACAAYFLKSWGKTCGGVSDTDIYFSSIVAKLGLGLFVCVLIYAIAYVPPPVSPYHDNFLNFSLADSLIVLIGLFYGAFLLPAVGLLILARGLRCRKYPKEPDDQGPATR